MFKDGGEEHAGLIIYGLASPGTIDRDPPRGLWVEGQPVEVFTLVGQRWEVVLWELALDHWPTGTLWRDRLTKTLRTMISHGATVAWVGAEGVPFADPPDLFDPEHMTGGVLDWLTIDGTSGGSLDPDKPLTTASHAQLSSLRRFAHGLADVD